MAGDCLAALRQCIIDGGAIRMVDANGQVVTDLAQCSDFLLPSGDAGGGDSAPAVKFGRSTPTRYLDSAASGADHKECFTLDAIVLAFLRKDSVKHADYFQECRRMGVKPVSLVVKRDLFDYLTGVTDTSTNLDNSTAVGGGTTLPDSSAATLSTSETKRRRLSITERSLVSRQTILSHGCSKNFDAVRKMAVSVLFHGGTTDGKSKTSASGKRDQRTSAAKPSSDAPAITDRKSGGRPREQPIPIIIVPASLTSAITLFNAREFLQDGTYKLTEDMRAQGAVKQNPLVLKRNNPRTGQPMVYHVIDSVDRLRAADWDRVVAVFTTGQVWQFRGWKWNEPVELFHKTKGFCIKFGDAAVDPTVREWNVTVLEVNRHKRHLDVQCVHNFWHQLEQWIASKKPALLQPAA